jgi:poly(3-hydroxybutyrate) depolymerase
MRTPASLVHCLLAVAALGGTLAACSGDEAKKSGSESGGGSGTGNGSGGANGGSAGTTGGSGGTTSGGSASGGESGTANGGSLSGGSSGTAGEGGTSSTTGGTASGGDAGMSGSAGTSGSPTGGSSGNGGSAGSGGGTPSAGCRAGGSPMSGRFTIDAGGTMREYIIKLPAAYDSTRPYRVIFTFHGRMYSAQTVAYGGPPGSGPYYGIEAVSDGNAIFVAPQATSSSWGNANDVPYIEAMIARFKAELCIDESRIFSVGFSAGAIMTLTASCEDDSVFRAIAPMSANLPAGCNGDDRARAYWGSHGTEDPTITIDAGETVRDSFVAKNGCTMTTMPGDREGCVNYQGCDAGAPVTWCTFSGVHEPPPYAGEAIWAFFSQF